MKLKLVTSGNVTIADITRALNTSFKTIEDMEQRIEIYLLDLASDMGMTLTTEKDIYILHDNNINPKQYLN